MCAVSWNNSNTIRSDTAIRPTNMAEHAPKCVEKSRRHLVRNQHFGDILQCSPIYPEIARVMTEYERIWYTRKLVARGTHLPAHTQYSTIDLRPIEQRKLYHQAREHPSARDTLKHWKREFNALVSHRQPSTEENMEWRWHFSLQSPFHKNKYFPSGRLGIGWFLFDTINARRTFNGTNEIDGTNRRLMNYCVLPLLCIHTSPKCLLYLAEATISHFIACFAHTFQAIHSICVLQRAA